QTDGPNWKRGDESRRPAARCVLLPHLDCCGRCYRRQIIGHVQDEFRGSPVAQYGTLEPSRFPSVKAEKKEAARGPREKLMAAPGKPNHFHSRLWRRGRNSLVA